MNIGFSSILSIFKLCAFITCDILDTGHFVTFWIQVHTGERRFICKTCNKKFTLATTLYQQELIHNGERRFNCATTDLLECHTLITMRGTTVNNDVSIQQL